MDSFIISPLPEYVCIKHPIQLTFEFMSFLFLGLRKQFYPFRLKVFDLYEIRQNMSLSILSSIK